MIKSIFIRLKPTLRDENSIHFIITKRLRKWSWIQQAHIKGQFTDCLRFQSFPNFRMYVTHGWKNLLQTSWKKCERRSAKINRNDELFLKDPWKMALFQHCFKIKDRRANSDLNGWKSRWSMIQAHLQYQFHYLCKLNSWKEQILPNMSAKVENLYLLVVYFKRKRAQLSQWIVFLQTTKGHVV